MIHKISYKFIEILARLIAMQNKQLIKIIIEQEELNTQETEKMMKLIPGTYDIIQQIKKIDYSDTLDSLSE